MRRNARLVQGKYWFSHSTDLMRFALVGSATGLTSHCYGYCRSIIGESEADGLPSRQHATSLAPDPLRSGAPQLRHSKTSGDPALPPHVRCAVRTIALPFLLLSCNMHAAAMPPPDPPVLPHTASTRARPFAEPTPPTRFPQLYKHGGLYLDTDVLVMRQIRWDARSIAPTVEMLCCIGVCTVAAVVGHPWGYCCRQASRWSCNMWVRAWARARVRVRDKTRLACAAYADRSGKGVRASGP